jgi:uncharacterized membrane protein
MSVRTTFSKKEHSDSGLALLLITLFFALSFNKHLILVVAVFEVLVLLIAPVLIFPFTFIWLNISDLMGKFLSKIILSAIFFIFVWPVALIRKAMGKDTLRLKDFKRDKISVFTTRNHTYSKTDFTNPF